MRQLCCSLGVVDGYSLWPEVEAPSHWRRVQPADRAALRETVRSACARKLKRREIARLIGNTESYVDKLIDELGLRTRRNRPRGTGAAIAAEAWRLLRDNPGLTRREVARRVGLKTYSHLSHLLTNHPEPTSEAAP